MVWPFHGRSDAVLVHQRDHGLGPVDYIAGVAMNGNSSELGVSDVSERQNAQKCEDTVCRSGNKLVNLSSGHMDARVIWNVTGKFRAGDVTVLSAVAVEDVDRKTCLNDMVPGLGQRVGCI